MEQLIQLFAVMAALLVSAVYLVRLYWKKHKAKSGCGACKALEVLKRRGEKLDSYLGEAESSRQRE